jgi:hypothetical protein
MKFSIYRSPRSFGRGAQQRRSGRIDHGGAPVAAAVCVIRTNFALTTRT